MTKKKLLLYGLNRSGTNYLQELLDRYFEVEFLNNEHDRGHPGHKHFRLYDNKKLIGRPNFKNKLSFSSFNQYLSHDPILSQADAYLIVSKDPYSWNLSYSEWGKKNNWEKSPHPYILEYNEFYRKWKDFATECKSIKFIRYIDLLENLTETLSSLQELVHLNSKSDTTFKKIKKVPMSHRFTNKKQNYYLNQQYLSEFSKEELDSLNLLLDKDLLDNLGYHIHHTS